MYTISMQTYQGVCFENQHTLSAILLTAGLTVILQMYNKMVIIVNTISQMIIIIIWTSEL